MSIKWRIRLRRTEDLLSTHRADSVFCTDRADSVSKRTESIKYFEYNRFPVNDALCKMVSRAIERFNGHSARSLQLREELDKLGCSCETVQDHDADDCDQSPARQVFQV